MLNRWHQSSARNGRTYVFRDWSRRGGRTTCYTQWGMSADIEPNGEFAVGEGWEGSGHSATLPHILNMIQWSGRLTSKESANRPVLTTKSKNMWTQSGSESKVTISSDFLPNFCSIICWCAVYAGIPIWSAIQSRGGLGRTASRPIWCGAGVCSAGHALLCSWTYSEKHALDSILESLRNLPGVTDESSEICWVEKSPYSFGKMVVIIQNKH